MKNRQHHSELNVHVLAVTFDLFFYKWRILFGRMNCAYFIFLSGHLIFWIIFGCGRQVQKTTLVVVVVLVVGVSSLMVQKSIRLS